MKQVRPAIVIGGIPRKGSIVFKHPREEIILSSHIELVWEILYFCDGLNSVDEIVKKVLKNKSFDEIEVRLVINDLTELGILMDSRKLYSYFHYIGNNLSPFVADITVDEVLELQDSPTLPPVAGTIIPLWDESPALKMLELASKRQSCRSFDSDKTFTTTELTQILWATYDKRVAPVPSAGGLFPLKVYFLLTRPTDTLCVGLYEYDHLNNSVVLLSIEPDWKFCRFALNSDSLLYNAPMIIVIAGDIHRQPTKYANRGYRYTLLEAGHVAQNIHLAAQEVGLASLEYGGYQDKQLHKLFNMHEDIVPLVTIALGAAGDKGDDDLEIFAEQLEQELVGKNKPVNRVYIVNSPDGDEGYSFFHAVSHFRAGNHDDARISYASRHCGGTGYSSSVAKLKAVAEGYERYASGQVRFDICTSASDLEGGWLDPRIYAPYANDQLIDGMQKQFCEEDTYEWIQGEKLRSGDAVFVPVELVFYPVSVTKLDRELCHFANSSGIAAHATRELAVKGALLELVERDAVLRSWYTRSAPPRLDPGLLANHWLERIDYWGKLGFIVDFLDMSHDGIQIVTVVIRSESHKPHFVSGTAASIDGYGAAIEKSFHEAELGLVVMLTKPSKGITNIQDIKSPEDHGLYYSEESQYSKLEFLWSRCDSIESESFGSLDDLIDLYDPVVVDIANKYSRLKVVRVFAEELIPINFGYGNDHFTHHSLPDWIRRSDTSEIATHYLA